MLYPIHEEDLSVNNDMKILATAIFYKDNIDSDIIFVTNDLSLKITSALFFEKDKISSIKVEEDNYKGYKVVQFNTEEEMADFYSNYLTSPVFDDIKINEYLILKDLEGEIIDRLVYTEKGYRNISFETFDSKQFGRIKPMDIQQQMAADSFVHNKLTLVRGKAGSGKSVLALGYLFN